ncbi:hypothetical protein ACBI99_16015 [Nonomuraea sp. ATR24]|uniref:hypothetical protein n=1 Tax=Nonomuraea sp. ATR24 TaxID=1676744 RepID=UPI0035C24808
MTTLERQYRLLLRAYPHNYRSDHGGELLDVLLESTEPGRRLPPAREAVALLVAGARTRLTQAARGRAWPDGLHLGVTVLTLIQLATLVPYVGRVPLWVGISAAAFLAVLRGRVLLALPLVAAAGVKVWGITHGRPVLDHTILPVYADPLWDAPALYGTGGPIAPAVSYLVAVAGLAVLALRREPVRARSWAWVAAAPVLAGADPAWLDVGGGLGGGSMPVVARVALESALLAGAAWAGRLTGDHRWAIAAGAYLLPALAILFENLAAQTRQDAVHWIVLLTLTLVAAAMPHRGRRHAVL